MEWDILEKYLVWMVGQDAIHTLHKYDLMLPMTLTLYDVCLGWIVYIVAFHDMI